MQYRNDKYGTPISLLGYGCMRFTKKGNAIDIDKAEKELMRALELGVNYLDTAYIYPGNEVAVGEILARNNCRDQVMIATKLPQYLIKSEKAMDKYFHEQLERLQTDYIDYYLMHMLTDVAAWEKLKKLGIETWIQEQKKAGRIKNIGFSYHGNTEMFIEILNDYDWDFCQIQYNYMDEHTQAGRKGLKEAAKKGIPVIIMEPLRGGKLVNLLPESGKKKITSHKRGWSAAEWALRWLWQQPEVTCILSGMNSVEMVEENCRIAEQVQVEEFTEDDYALIEQVKEEIHKTLKVGCTECRYCVPCPMGIDIPGTFRCYNHLYTEKRSSARIEYLQTIALQKEMSDVSKCIKCGKCQSHCPQHIEIPKKLVEAEKELVPWYFKLAIKLVRRLRLFW